jgi:hypothetical protein
MSAEMDGNLWQHNFSKVVVVDVSDDYGHRQPPLPSNCYPIVTEILLPKVNLPQCFKSRHLVAGFLYDWHQTPNTAEDVWYVGVVRKELITTIQA